jgi:ATP-dependent helicase/nuclease subunit A
MTQPFLFISAGAGSGKTYRLADLLHEMLVDGRVRASGVIATSFTNKSAAELRERVRAHLIGKGRYTLATAIGQSRIGTVNSICGNLLARFAFEAGLPSEQRVLDEVRSGLLLNESMDEVIEGEALTQLLTIVRRLGLAEAQFGQDGVPWKKVLKDIVSQARANAIDPGQLCSFGDRNADALLTVFPTPSDRDLDAALRAAIEAALPPIRQKVGEGAPKNTAEYLEVLERAARDFEAGELSWAQWNALSSREPQAALRSVVQPVKDAAAENARHPALHQDIRAYLRLIFKLAADVLDTYRVRKRQLGVIDFTDQERELLNIIDLPAVAETLREELDLVMVDEFQDTSPIQLALFLKLGQLAKQVVWVGDVKQAIYGFRGGDAKLMTAVLGKLPELHGEKEILQYSWRSRPSLVALVNELFGDAFPDLSAADIELQPKREDFSGTAAVEDWLLEGKAAEQQQGIASGIAALIQEGTVIVDRDTNQPRPLRLGDIAILARANPTVRSIAEVLRKRNIAAATEQPGLLQRPEIVLALACLRRLNDDRDTIATAEIVSLAQCEDPDSWLAERLAWMDGGAPPADWREEGDDALPIFQAIRSLREQKPLLSPREAVELVTARCHLSRLVIQWEQSPEQARVRLANLERLTEIVADYEDECRSGYDVATLSGFLLWLKELEAADQDELAQPSIDAVRVMTHHGAKGLEWPVVVLVNLEGDVKDAIFKAVRAESLTELDVSRPLHERTLRYWPWPYGAQKNQLLSDNVDASETGQRLLSDAVDEHKRLLYVSLTRARDMVVLARSAKKLDGEWMATVGLAGRLPDEDATELILSNGTRVPFRRRRPNEEISASGLEIERDDLQWFAAPQTLTAKLPLTVSPSSAVPIRSRITEVATIGARITINDVGDSATVGEAVHACLALHLISRDRPFTSTEVHDILGRLGVAGAVDAEALATQVAAVSHWLTARWPGAESLVEVPISRAMPNGQEVHGRIDLLLRAADGWVLFDHKASAADSGQWDALAASYGGQLAAYSDVIESVTGRPVKEAWLVLPTAGVGLRIGSAKAEAAIGVL